MLTIHAPNAAPGARSPLRYPGGKSWLAGLIKPLLRAAPATAGAALTEVFAGGASIGCDLLHRVPGSYLHLNELDPDLHTFWQVVFSDQAEELARRVRQAGPTMRGLQAELAVEPVTPVDHALRLLIRNRLNYGGILAKAGLTRTVGDSDDQRPARWYPVTHAERILSLARHRHRVKASGDDALSLLATLRDHPGVVFVDPPYTATRASAGHLLYRHTDLDHAELMRLCAALRGPWLMTHEDHPEVIDLALGHGLTVRRLVMSGNMNSMRSELAIGRNLAWLQPHPTLFGSGDHP